MKTVIILILLFGAKTVLFGQTNSVTVSVSVNEEIKENFINTGRIFLFLNTTSKEPRRNTWPNKSNLIYATNLQNWDGKDFTFNAEKTFSQSQEIFLNEIPSGKYYVQVLWDQDKTESRINAPGNLYSETVLVDLKNDSSISVYLNQIIPEPAFPEHRLLKKVDVKSEILSEWWGKEMRLKAAVLLPTDFYNNPDQKYPVRYNIAGYGGRYTRAAQLLNDSVWLQSSEAPKIIQVFLDGEGPFGDSYQLNSENSGPYGTALTQELIPFFEKEFRGIESPEFRFLDGCSTGGWVSLALQLFYPGFFGGCFSYSPDPVDFDDFQLINIYNDKNAFINEHGYLRPVVRETSGEPMVSMKDFIQYENVLGNSDSYLTSGGQFSAFTALYSPKGEDGLPAALFDPFTGSINKKVAEHWKKYDLKQYVEKNWEKLGPKLQGKIWIWGAGMDNFYLTAALHNFDEMLKKQKNPESDAEISFTPQAGHCQEYNHRKVLKQIKTKLEKIN